MFFFFEDWDFHSANTHKLHGDVLLQFNCKSMCNSYFVFLLTKNDIIVHYNKFPNLGVYRATFPNLKGPRAPSQNCKKIPVYPTYLNIFTPHFPLIPLYNSMVKNCSGHNMTVLYPNLCGYLLGKG